MFSFRHSGEQFSSRRTLLEADALVCLATGLEAQSGKLKQKGCGEEGGGGSVPILHVTALKASPC